MNRFTPGRDARRPLLRAGAGGKRDARRWQRAAAEDGLFPRRGRSSGDWGCGAPGSGGKLKADCGDPKSPGHDYYIYYLHIDSLAAGIADGKHVDQGQLVAYSGNSGCSSGPHIHIETASVPSGGKAVLDTCSSVDPATRYCP